jgi:hypothetical protein
MPDEGVRVEESCDRGEVAGEEEMEGRPRGVLDWRVCFYAFSKTGIPRRGLMDFAANSNSSSSTDTFSEPSEFDGGRRTRRE